MTLPEFTDDEKYLIESVKSNIAGATNSYMWGYMIGGAIIAEVDGAAMPVVPLVSLYAGIGAGVLWASYTDVSVERSRFATWGGYLGSLLGLGLAGFAGAREPDALLWGMLLGAGGGLTLFGGAAAGLDDLAAGPLAEIVSAGVRPSAFPTVAGDGDIADISWFAAAVVNRAVAENDIV